MFLYYSHPQKDGLDFAAVLPFLLLRARVQDIFGGNTSVGDALAVANHPDENIRDAVLRLR